MDHPFTVALVSLYDIENNAVRTLAAELRRNGFRALEIYFRDWRNNAFDPPGEEDWASLRRVLTENGAGLVGLSLRASAYLKLATEMTERVRLMGIPVAWGGAHVILCPEDSARVADYACTGEGERPLVALARALASGERGDEVRGLFVRGEGGQIGRNAREPLIEDLDSVPFRCLTHEDKFVIFGSRVRRGVDPMASDPIFQIMCSRGCPFICSYCHNATLRQIYKGLGRYYRARSVGSVISEISEARRQRLGIRRVKFDDELFNVLDPAWLDEFCARYPAEVGLPFELFTEPRVVERETFERLKAAGLTIVYMGVQNTERVTTGLYDRDVPDDAVRQAAKTFRELGLDARYQVMVDDPMSTHADEESLFDLLASLPRPFQLYLFSLTIFPNTPIAEKLLKNGAITEDDIEGRNQKTFRQMRVDLAYPRKPESTFWIALLVLVSKSFVPVGLLRLLARGSFFKRHPRPLVLAAQAANAVKMVLVAGGMVVRREMTWTLIRRWARLDSLITQ